MEMRRFTDYGLEQFRRYLTELHGGSKVEPPRHLLTDTESSESFSEAGEIEQRSFSTRLEAAGYFHIVLSEVEDNELQSDVHLWSWFSLLYFDDVCPPQSDGGRKPGRDYRHIPEPGYQHGHRHLLGGAYLVYSVHGWGEKLSRLLLSTKPSVESRFHHELAARQNLITNRGVMEAADLLYFDEERGRPKPGAARREFPGGLYRFIDVIQQLDLTYDLYSMKGREMVGLLPPEFQPWLHY